MRRNFLVFSVEINRKFTQNMNGTVYDSGIREATVASLPASSAVKMALQATHEATASLADVYC